jgi:hypothetical protein
MTHGSYSSVDDELATDGHHPSRRMVRVLLLAIILALVLLTVAGPDSFEYTLARSPRPIHSTLTS